jgi:type II secretory pathway pseudopilin PulG
MDELPPRRRWLPSPGFLVFLGILVVVVALAIPGLLSSNRASNERAASTNLKTLTSAEADFRANDRDGNRINDFWTGDVSGLYYVKPTGGGPEIRLIEEGVANADAKTLFPRAKGMIPKGGYLFQAFDWDDSVDGPEGEYKRDTDKSGRKVHNESRFGFCAFPKSAGDGKYVFFVNENNTIFRDPVTEPRTTFPSDEELKRLSCKDD